MVKKLWVMYRGFTYVSFSHYLYLHKSVNPGLRLHSILCVFFTLGCLLVVRRVYPPSMVGGVAAEVELADTHFWISEDSTKTIHFNVSQFCFGNIFTAICRKVKVLFDL